MARQLSRRLPLPKQKQAKATNAVSFTIIVKTQTEATTRHRFLANSRFVSCALRFPLFVYGTLYIFTQYFPHHSTTFLPSPHPRLLHASPPSAFPNMSPRTCIRIPPFLALLLLSLFLLRLPTALSAACGPLCVFRFCSIQTAVLQPNAPVIPLPPKDSPFPYFICSPQIRRLGLIRSLGRPILDTGASETPRDRVFLSDWRPDRLRQNFANNFFTIAHAPGRPGTSTILRGRASSNQRTFIDSRCIIIPVTAWDLLRRDGTIAKTETRPEPNLGTHPLTNMPVVRQPKKKERRPCLAFRTVYPLALVQLSWDSSDDLDLSVTEPGGTVVDKRILFSLGGTHSGDANVGVCGIAPGGVESVSYGASDEASIKEGVYKVKVSHFNNCAGGRKTRWKLMVAIGEHVVEVRKGMSGRDDGQTIATVSFRL